MLKDSAPAFEAQASAIRRRLLAGTVLQSDETSMRVGRRTFWVWVFHHGDSACFVIRPLRGKAVVAAFLGDVRPAFWVSDRLGAQIGWAAKEHQVCLAHLLRDIQYALDAGDDALAPRIMALLKRAIRIGRRRPELAGGHHARHLSRPPPDQDRRPAHDRSHHQGGTETPAHPQALPSEPARFHLQPRRPADQQRL
jgi:transposase